ncbi:hypothetical protein TrST_g2917 [Triparma strigata]|uniref:GB1/RHD3-type G domain-containing protein n=1 Tax=Triparma strigata TaxID=1606541 RepID=A0A9W7BNI2_9STRA|nr:hypothetical protein TrST_g2917 [Triparma strigata]
MSVSSDPSAACAVQIVSLGSEDDDHAFNLNEEALTAVLNKAPSNRKVSVISCVGAFRSGKSFLLSNFLRYLRYYEVDEKTGDVKSRDEGGEKWYTTGGKLSENDRFEWRGGSERHTTGIWIWSHPFTLRGANGELLSVYVVDTQGLFDNETTMSLTASIFGLSTLLSSYSIYNVAKQISEDSLQHLALFSEYGRTASDLGGDGDKKAEKTKPFQKLEFLVRDWQNFEVEDPSTEDDFAEMEASMNSYIQSVIADRDAVDLKETREQIATCFEKVDAFLLPHPGLEVTKKKYDGDPAKVDPTFMALLDRYCGKVFSSELEPKRINGRYLTAPELCEYIKAYAAIFSSGKDFPAATTLLAATAAASNNNAKRISVEKYKSEMDNLAGPNVQVYHQPEELSRHHNATRDASLTLFDSIATFGSSAPIMQAKAEVKSSVEEAYEVYVSLNSSRNPLAGFETYVLPCIVAVSSYILRTIVDLSCTSWSQTCKASSDVLGQVTSVILLFLLIVAATKAKLISARFNQVKSALMVMAPPTSDKKNS